MKRTIKIMSIVSFVLSIFLFVNSRVLADDTSITGNGSGSDNTVISHSTDNITVSQANTASVSNSVQSNLTTGNNQASDNTGGSSVINTGDAISNTSIKNSANSNSAHLESTNCCSSSNTTSRIKNNGSFSQNTISSASNTQTNVSSNNNATITSTISGNTNTGNNVANNNTGNAFIGTGNMLQNTSMTNGPINASQVSLPGEFGNANVSEEIKNNGSYSTNTISTENNNKKSINELNNSFIFNNINLKLKTGENTANYNTGNVGIFTGNIIANTSIINGPINSNEIAVICVCKEHQKQKQLPPIPSPVIPVQAASAPVPTTTVSSQNPSEVSSSVTPAQLVAAVQVGKILPATGTNWLFFALLSNIVMFLMGMLLRLRSGRSPGFMTAG